MENIKIEYTDEQKDLIEATLLKGCTEYEKMQVWHLADKYGLDLLQKGQIWVTGFGNQKNIIVGRDGMLTIAHRCGGIKFFKSEPIYRPDDVLHEQNPIGAYCVIERLDNGARTEQVANFKDYNTGKALWATKPSEMITKVAESKCLRKAFDMSGFYSQEEFDDVKSAAHSERDSSIEEAEKGYSEALFKSRKEREAEAAQKPVEKKAEPEREMLHPEKKVSAQEPAPVTDMKFNPYDLGRLSMSALDFADFCKDIEANYMCKITGEERDACRRSDGKYDMEAAKVLQKSKFQIFSDAKTGVKA